MRWLLALSSTDPKFIDLPCRPGRRPLLPWCWRPGRRPLNMEVNSSSSNRIPAPANQSSKDMSKDAGAGCKSMGGSGCGIGGGSTYDASTGRIRFKYRPLRLLSSRPISNSKLDFFDPPLAAGDMRGWWVEPMSLPKEAWPWGAWPLAASW